ncbi:hypothetical protein GF376_01690 [Candidatus Peregrinibacteria bacterium]|nr:hypothetical protein [Candidatus Peregrinibacteria bacterium]
MMVNDFTPRKGQEMKELNIAIAMGDGSGPEMMLCAKEVAEVAAGMDGYQINWHEASMGWAAYEKYGDTIPQSSLETAVRLKTLFFGGVGDPKFDNTIGKEHPEMKPEGRCLLKLRDEMGLLLNIRPMIFWDCMQDLSNIHPRHFQEHPGQRLELHFVRFLLEDSYFGTRNLFGMMSDSIQSAMKALGLRQKSEVTGEEERVIDMSYYKSSSLERYFEAVFAYAKERDLPVTSIDKANIMARYMLWRRVFNKVSAKQEDVKGSVYVDAAAANLIQNPFSLHGVIACGNEHGDILSDAGAGALRSMGMMCSSSINPDTDAAMFESGAGTAPELAGKNVANPIGRILTAAMMLRHLGAVKGANAIEQAVQKTLFDGFRTADIREQNTPSDLILGTKEITVRILDNLN